MNNQTQEWKHRALEAEAAVEEGLDLVRDLLKDHYLEMREAQANAFQIICQVALEASTADDATGEHSGILGRTISMQLDTIRDQTDKIERVENERDENAKNLSLAFADQAALRRELRRSQTRINELEQLNVIAHEKQRDLETDIVRLREQLEQLESDAVDAREESTEAIRKCGDQLGATVLAAKLREQQVRLFARLWLAAYEHSASPLGSQLTHQLHRIFADHGIDVDSMP